MGNSASTDAKTGIGVTPFRIAVISRGRGRGHAVPDMAIAQELQKLVPALDIRFVSYADGAEACKKSGFDVIDLMKPPNPPLLDIIIAVSRAIGNLGPQLVVAHEEYAAMPACQIFAIPCLYLTDFFEDPAAMSTNAMRYAAEVIFLGEKGVFTEPHYLRERISYVGPAVRSFDYSVKDRTRARNELGIQENAKVAIVIPGFGNPEATTPSVDMIMASWRSLDLSNGLLIWVAGHDYEAMKARLDGSPDIRILKDHSPIDQLMVAGDLVITKGNRVSVYESSLLGIPSISLSNGVNWPDDVAIARVHSNIALSTGSTTPQQLAECIRRVFEQDCLLQPTPKWQGISKAAERVVSWIGRLRSAPNRSQVRQL